MQVTKDYLKAMVNVLCDDECSEHYDNLQRLYHFNCAPYIGYANDFYGVGAKTRATRPLSASIFRDIVRDQLTTQINQLPDFFIKNQKQFDEFVRQAQDGICNILQQCHVALPCDFNQKIESLIKATLKDVILRRLAKVEGLVPYIYSYNLNKCETYQNPMLTPLLNKVLAPPPPPPVISPAPTTEQNTMGTDHERHKASNT